MTVSLEISYPELPSEDVFATRKRIAYVLEQLRKHRQHLNRPLRILDFGCGNAVQMGQYLINKVDSYVGVDIHEPSLEFARRNYGSPSARFMSALPDDGTFDAIIVCEVLEHLDDPAGVLRSVAERLAPDGIVIGSVPNGYGLTEIEKYVDRKLGLYRGLRGMARFVRTLRKTRQLAAPAEIPYNYDSGHVQFFTKSALRKMAETAHLNLTELRNGSVMGADLSGVTVLRPSFLIQLNVRVADRLPNFLAATWFFRMALSHPPPTA